MMAITAEIKGRNSNSYAVAWSDYFYGGLVKNGMVSSQTEQNKKTNIMKSVLLLETTARYCKQYTSIHIQSHHCY